MTTPEGFYTMIRDEEDFDRYAGEEPTKEGTDG